MAAAVAILLAGAALLLPGSGEAMERIVPFLYCAWQSLKLDSPVCSRPQAALGLWEAEQTLAAGRSTYPRIRPLADDGHGYRLWESPVGQWWFPANTDPNHIRFALTQYVVTAYPGLQIRPGAVVLDCGGYVGDWAHWALQHGASRVVVFEPASAQLECIRRNLAGPIREGRVILIPKGVWDEPGTLRLQIVPGNPAANSVTDQPGEREEAIQLTTIDAVVDELRLDRLDAIKMDIEGAEVRALRGARRTLARFRPQLAVATEHTADMLQNNRNVIQTMREIAPSYRFRCGYCSLSRDRRRIIPETLYFYPE
ncbi:MAG: FkbM family methyltransferase [Bryobacteraceae bacterium]|nr:FkbM family methyltransferase [Bryobacteraceae bacterium]